MEHVARTVGVIMLETRFPRLRGDIGNPDGFDFPIIYSVVKDASPRRVVVEQQTELVSRFIEAAQKLVNDGAAIITTSCGFLAPFQNEIQNEINVPFFSSGLLLLPELERQYGSGNIGILTISKKAMSPAFRFRAGIGDEVAIGSPESGMEFTQAILSNRTAFDETQCEIDIVNAACSLQLAHPNIRALLLECTNMPPYTVAIQQATNLPIYSLNSLLNAKAFG